MMGQTSRGGSNGARHRAPLRVAVVPLCLALLLLACGSASQAGVTAATTSRHLAPVVRSATARVPAYDSTPVSTSCQPGERMLGGGFIASNLFEYAAYIYASYPSGPTTWTVVGYGPASYFQLEADVYCAADVPAAAVHIVHASGASTATATCPQGTVLLGGGFQSSRPVGISRPQGNGWLATVEGSGVQTYAVCAARLVRPGQVVRATFNPHSMAHSYYPSGADTICPSGQTALGGGFESGDLVLASGSRSASFDGWEVEAGGEADVTISAVCVVLTAGL
jgi:hypothetical protein